MREGRTYRSKQKWRRSRHFCLLKNLRPSLTGEQFPIAGGVGRFRTENYPRQCGLWRAICEGSPGVLASSSVPLGITLAYTFYGNIAETRLSGTREAAAPWRFPDYRT